jgi:cytoskeletal protein CcmA (bactofilin family)
MSVFRNPRPGDKEGEPNRFGEAAPPRPENRPENNGDLLQNIPNVEPMDTSRSTFPAFERETPREPPRTAPTPGDGRGPTPLEKCTNVIASGSRWNGSLNIEDSVRIEGHLTGEVNAKGTIHIAEGAQVEAKLRAAYVVISGAFKGEVRCDERLELMPKSRVEGEMVTKVLNVHEGAIVDGSIQMANEPVTASQRAKEAVKTS